MSQASEKPEALPITAKRRSFPPSHDFFAEGNLEREETVYLESLKVEQTGQSAPSYPQGVGDSCPFECGECGKALPSRHLLDLHLSETHDAFSKAQAARRMHTLQCLVEGCGKSFGSIMDRRKHLHDAHAYPTRFAWDRLHLKARQAQARPDALHQKPSLGKRPQQRMSVEHSPDPDRDCDAELRQPLREEAAAPRAPPAGNAVDANAVRGGRKGPTSQVNNLEIDELSRDFSSLKAPGQPKFSQPPTKSRGRGRRVIV